MNAPTRANLGCGGQIVRGWMNVDRHFDRGDPSMTPWPSYAVERDMRGGLPFGDDELDYAVCHHVLDLFNPCEASEFLHECKRVLKPGGVLRVSLGDIEGAIDAGERHDFAWFADLALRARTIGEAISEYVYLNGARQSVLTRTIVANMLEAAHLRPFVVAYRHTIMRDDDAICALDTRPTESIWLEGIA